MSNQIRRHALKRTALAVVLGACLANGAVYAQSTTGSIYGSAPSEAGSTIVVQSDTGLSRTITIDANGRYNLGSLPVGAYTVTLKRGDQVVDTRKNVQLRVGSGTEVSFAGAAASGSTDATTLGAITVTAANAPKIDVSSTRLAVGDHVRTAGNAAAGTQCGGDCFTRAWCSGRQWRFQ